MSGTDEQISIQRDFDSAPMAVYEAWVQPESFAQWFGGRDVEVPNETLDFVAEAGRTWRATMNLPDGNQINWTGEFVEVTPPSRLVFTITDAPAEPGRGAVTVDLVPITGGTQLTMTQETPGFSTEQQVQLVAGWQSFLDVIADLARDRGSHEGTQP